MRCASILLMVVVLAAACERPSSIPDEDLALRVSVAQEEVELGKAFPLTVVRIWNRDLEPDPWNDKVLAPLIVRLEETARLENALRIEETRRYRAYAFDREAVLVPAPSFKARPKSGGPAREATGTEIRLRVKPILDPKTAGPPELPSELLPETTWWPLWAAVGALILVAATLFVRASRRRSAKPDAPVVPPILPHERALARIRKLREQEPHTSEETQAWYVEASSIVRDDVADELGVRAPEMTTEELITSPGIRHVPGTLRTLLSEILGSCDRVKFGRHPSSTPERERLLMAVEASVLQMHGRERSSVDQSTQLREKRSEL